MNRKFKSLDDLIEGIEQILLKNRDSFSIQEIELLVKAKLILTDLKQNPSIREPDTEKYFSNALGILLRVFLDANFSNFM